MTTTTWLARHYWTEILKVGPHGPGTGSLHPTESIRLHVRRMAGVAGCAQLRDQGLEVGGALGAAGAEGELRGGAGALIEFAKIGPHVGRGERVGRGIPIGSGLPLIGASRKQVREG